MNIKELLRENSFKQLDKDDAAIAIDGNIAFNINGTYKYFDKSTEEIVECQDFTLMQIGNMFMRALTTEIKAGDDIILYDKEDTELFSLSHVLEVKDNKVKVIRYDDGTIVTNKSIPSMLFKNTKFYVKIMPLMPGLNIGNAENNPFANMMKGGEDNSMNPMLMMMAMNNSEGENDMLKTMMLMNMMNGNSGTTGNMNPMMLMMAMNNSEGENDMLKTMMLMNMMNGNGEEENNMNPLLMMMAMNNDGENDMLKTMMLMNMMKGGDITILPKEEKNSKKNSGKKSNN